MFPFLDDIDVFVLIHSPTDNPLCIWAFDRLFQRYLSKDPLKKTITVGSTLLLFL